MDKNTLLSLIATELPDNTSGDIEPADLRAVLYQMVSSDLNLEELTTQLAQGLIEMAKAKFTAGLTNPAYEKGLVFYDDTKNALSYFNDDPEVTLNIGQETLVKIYNDNGATLINGTVIRLAGGSIGGIPTVVRSIADSVPNAQFTAVCTHDIAVGETGYVTIIGTISGLDTSAFSGGDFLYLSSTNAGEFTNIEQPIISVVGKCLVSDASDGVILTIPSEVKNPIAIGQATTTTTGAAIAITTTPVPVQGYDSSVFEKNLSVTTPAGGSGQNRGIIEPESAPFSGFYDVAFIMAVSSSANAVVTCEIYVNGVGTGLISTADFTNNITDEGSIVFPRAITQTVISAGVEIEIYMYSSANTNVTISSLNFNATRLGQA